MIMIIIVIYDENDSNSDNDNDDDDDDNNNSNNNNNNNNNNRVNSGLPVMVGYKVTNNVVALDYQRLHMSKIIKLLQNNVIIENIL